MITLIAAAGLSVLIAWASYRLVVSLERFAVWKGRRYSGSYEQDIVKALLWLIVEDILWYTSIVTISFIGVILACMLY